MDGRSILYVDDLMARYYDPRSQSERDLLKIKLPRAMALTPDRRGLIYIEGTGAVQRQRITNFASRPRPL